MNTESLIEWHPILPKLIKTSLEEYRPMARSEAPLSTYSDAFRGFSYSNNSNVVGVPDFSVRTLGIDVLSAKISNNEIRSIGSDSASLQLLNSQRLLPTENDSNQSFEVEAAFLEKCNDDFVRIASSEAFEYGFIPSSQLLMESFASQFPSVGRIAQHIFFAGLESPQICVAVMNAISCMPYETSGFYGAVLAMAALSHHDDEVKEAGIRAFERWEHPDGIKALKSIHTNWDWVEKYRLSTIAFLESNNGVSD